MINAIKSQRDDECYTLDGLRVDRPSKGLYIKNGKIILMK